MTSLGGFGERQAADWYLSHGYRVLDQNWRDGRRGELDLVAANDDVVVFCEVKTRSGSRQGGGSEAVTPAKQRQVRQLATAWLACHDGNWPRVRFDVVDVNRRGHLKIYEDCF